MVGVFSMRSTGSGQVLASKRIRTATLPIGGDMPAYSIGEPLRFGVCCWITGMSPANRKFRGTKVVISVLPVIHPEAEPERAFRTMASCNELRILIDKIPEEKLCCDDFLRSV
jgi:hypothetical protein